MSAATRTPFAVIRPTADRIVEGLSPFCRRIELAGSLRREKSTIGDIEIVAIPIRPMTLFGEELFNQPTPLDRFLDGRNITFAKRGARYQQFTYGRHTIDLFLATADTWGSVCTIRTGSWEFSRWLVTSRAAGGAKPDEVQFRDGRLLANGRLLDTPEEADVFAALGLVWIEPYLRHGPVANPARIDPVWDYEGE